MRSETALGSAWVDRLIVAAGNVLRLPRNRLARAVKLRRQLAHPLALSERTRIARQLKGGVFSDFVSSRTAFRLFGPTELPGTEEAVTAAREVLTAWERAPSANALWRDAGPDEQRPHTFNILADEDLDRYPAIMSFALSRPVVEAIAGYLGQIPRLRQLGVHVTLAEPGGPSLRHAQKLHRDAPEQRSRKVRIFINLDEVGRETGPFTFLPLDLTRSVVAATKGVEPADGDVERLCGVDAFVALAGPAGTGVFVDTSLCLHYGGRVSAGRRAMLMLHYTAVPDARVGRPPFEQPRHGRYDLRRFLTDDPIRRLLLNQHG